MQEELFSKRCPCRKRNVLCHTRCHAGHNCQNSSNEKENVTGQRNVGSIGIVLPSYGGKVGSANFSNTCPIDNWLAMLGIITEESVDIIINKVHENNVDFVIFLKHIKHKRFMEAKLQLVHWNNIQKNFMRALFFELLCGRILDDDDS